MDPFKKPDVAFSPLPILAPVGQRKCAEEEEEERDVQGKKYETIKVLDR